MLFRSDGSMTVVALDGLVLPKESLTKHRDTYSLPELYQTKLAMLRMMEYKQAIASIGVKVPIENTNWYFMPSCDIITTS